MTVISSEPLRSLEAIKSAFGISTAKVREWEAAGAPILILRNNKGQIKGYKSEYNSLLEWCIGYERKIP